MKIHFFFPSWECLDTGVGCPESQWNISICGIFKARLNKALNELVKLNVLCTRVWAAWPDRAPLQSELFCNSIRIGVFLPQDWHAQNLRHAVYFTFSKLIRKKILNKHKHCLNTGAWKLSCGCLEVLNFKKHLRKHCS